MGVLSSVYRRAGFVASSLSGEIEGWSVQRRRRANAPLFIQLVRSVADLPILLGGRRKGSGGKRKPAEAEG